MATKFKLIPDPTFKSTVTIPCAGDKDGELTFTFKHKKISEAYELTEKSTNKEITNTEYLMEFIEGWALPDTFNAENLGILLDNYPGAGYAIASKYFSELSGLREKN